MEKPIVLKRRLRLERWEIALLVLWFGFLVWWLTQNSVGGMAGLLSFVFLNAHTFLKRVTLTKNRIAIWDDDISNRVYPFERILRCSFEPDKDKVNIEMVLQHRKTPSYAIFGNRPISPPQRLTRVIYFSIEPEQLDPLANYLSGHAVAIEKKPARETWKENYLAKRARLLRERDDLSDEEAAKILREIEEQLARLQKY